MSQPVRKQILEAHPDIITDAPTLTLLVDGNSLLFNAMKDDKVGANGLHVGGIFQMLLQIRMRLQDRVFDKVIVTFDDEFSGVLRWKQYSPYKQNRDKHYEDYGMSDYMREYNANMKAMMNYFNKKKAMKKNGELRVKHENDWEKFIEENFARERDRLCLYFNELCIRWMMDEVCEGDDLIAYYCKNKKPNEKIIIVSSDMDLCQLLSEDVMIYNQSRKEYIANRNFQTKFGYPYQNVLVKKIFCGDTSDNIGNIKGMSEARFFEMMPEAKTREVTVDEVKARAQELIDERIANKKKPMVLHENILNGVSNQQYEGDFYLTNRLIIDLSNPLLTDSAKEEVDAAIDTPLDVTDRTDQNLVKLIYEDGITDLMGEGRFATFFSPFKRISEMEKKFYENECGK